MENVALWHERDISHSSVERMIGPDATVTLDFALARLAGVIEKLVVYPENMAKNLDRLGGLVHSQRVLLALSQKGVAREDAYRLVQRNAMRVWDEGGDFLALLKADPDVSKALSPAELEALFDLGYHTKHVDTIFARVFVGLQVLVADRAGMRAEQPALQERDRPVAALQGVALAPLLSWSATISLVGPLAEALRCCSWRARPSRRWASDAIWPSAKRFQRAFVIVLGVGEAHPSVGLGGHQNQLLVRAALSPDERLVDLHERCYGASGEVIAPIGRLLMDRWHPSARICNHRWSPRCASRSSAGRITT